MASYSFLVKIGADISDFSDKMSKVQSKMSTVGDGLMNAGQTMATAITLPLVGIAGASTKMAMDFEQGMANVGAVAGATGEQMQQLSDLAIKMGADTQYSATESAKGMEELIKAGVSVNDILGKNALGGALALASAGEISLAESAEIASTALNAFKADSMSVSTAADILAGASNASATSVQELRYGLSASSSVASAVGMTFKDTATALALFANNGLKGSDAGTSLKTMLMNLQPQTKAQKALFEQLGLVTADGSSKFYDASGKLKSLSDISGILKSSMSGLNDAQRLQAMTTIFGSDAIRGANILFKEGTAGVQAMQDAMGNVTAQDVATKKMDTLKGSVERMKGSLETAGIIIGQNLTPNIGALAGFVEKLTNAFVSLTPEQQSFIVTVLSLVASLGPLIIAIAIGLKMFAGLQKMAVLLKVSTSFLAGTIGLVVLAIIALIAIGWLVVSNWDKIVEFFKWAGAEIVKAWNNVGTFFSNLWNGITTGTQSAWDSIVSFLSGIWTSIVTTATSIWGGITTFFSNLWTSIVATATSIWNGIIMFFTVTVPQKFQLMLDWFASLPSKIGTFLSTLPETIAYWIGFALGTMVRLTIEGIANAIKFFKELPDKVATFFSNLYQSAVTWFTNTWNYISTVASNIYKSVVAWFSQLPTRISEYFGSMYNNAVARLQALYNGVVTWLRYAYNYVVSMASSIFNSMVNYFSQLPGRISGYFSSMYYNVSSWISSLASRMYSAGANMVSNFVNALWGLPNSIWSVFNNVWSTISDWRSSLVSKMRSVASSMWQGFKDGLGIHSPSYVEQAFMAMAESSNTALASIKSGVPKLQSALNTLQSPSLALAGAVDYGFMNGSPTAEQNNFNIGSLVVREDADVYRIAEELYKLQQSKLRGQGR